MQTHKRASANGVSATNRELEKEGAKAGCGGCGNWWAGRDLSGGHGLCGQSLQVQKQKRQQGYKLLRAQGFGSGADLGCVYGQSATCGAGELIGGHRGRDPAHFGSTHSHGVHGCGVHSSAAVLWALAAFRICSAKDRGRSHRNQQQEHKPKRYELEKTAHSY